MKFQRKIDFQAHYLPPCYYDFLAEEGLFCPDGFPTPQWDEAWQQEMMGELGIAYALLSVSSPSQPLRSIIVSTPSIAPANRGSAASFCLAMQGVRKTVLIPG